MNRPNRLIILIGVVLAIAAFGAILLLGNQPANTGKGTQPASPTVNVVVATTDMPVGTVVTSDMVTLAARPATTVTADALRDVKAAIGLPVRKDVLTDAIITQSTFGGVTAATNADLLRRLKPGLRAMAVQVDQLTGVGTLIQPGDRVDVVIALETTDNKFPVVEAGPPPVGGNPQSFLPLGPDVINRTTVKVLVQNVEVLGTLLPAAAQPTTTQQQNAQATTSPGTTLNGQQQIAVLALTPEQVEIVRFAQLDSQLSLVLRATADAAQPNVTTTGATLRTLVEKYGVLPPKVIVVPQP